MVTVSAYPKRSFGASLPSLSQSTKNTVFIYIAFVSTYLLLGWYSSQIHFSLTPPTPSSSNIDDPLSTSKPFLPLYDDAEGAARILIERAQTPRPVPDEAIIPEIEKARCERYGMPYDPSRKTRRRIFMGGLIADDSWHMIGAMAMEAYGIWTHAAFIESNTTQMFYERELRFVEGTEAHDLLTKRGMFGPNTDVTVDYYVDPPAPFPQPEELLKWKWGGALMRENFQREVVLKRWKEAGMTEDDLGYVADADETFTRDYFRALQICDVPEFHAGQTCKAPKLSASTIIFEGSPHCINYSRRIFRPDITRGECLLGIGNGDGRPTGGRVWYNDLGWQKGGSKCTTKCALWNAADYRMTQAGGKLLAGIMYNGKNDVFTGYHFHNFFPSVPILRGKYHSYAHAVDGADSLPLSEINKDLKVMVDCLSGSRDGYQQERYKKVGGPMPVAFESVPEYANMWHEDLKKMILEDEEKIRNKAA